MKKYSRAEISEILTISSFSGLLLFYANKLAIENKVAYILSDLINDIGIGTSEGYFQGYLVACTSVGLIDYTENRKIISVISVDEEIVAQIDDAIEQRINNQESDSTKKIWSEYKSKVFKYFTTEKS